MALRISRSDSLITVPERKLIESKIKTLKNCETCSKGDIKLNNACNKCRAINTAITRYAESNIPVSYWNLRMSDFKGSKILLDKYNEIVSDLSATYNEGVCICLAGNHGVGKQLSLDTELPTIDGFIRLAELKVGDKLFDENGNVCNVTHIHPINLSPESYEVEFDDGTKIDACAEHLWLTWDRNCRVAHQKLRDQQKQSTELSPKVRTTKEILQTLRVGGKQQITNHSIPCSKPIQYCHKDLPINPYTLGCWLGDGSVGTGDLECADKEILDNIKDAGYSINLKQSSLKKESKSRTYRIGDLVIKDGSKGQIGRLKKQLKKLNVLYDKHIPEIYLYASYEQRLALLQGLMDTDGCCYKRGLIEFCSTIPKLAKQVKHLILSMGIKSKINISKSFLYGKRCKDRYRITFTTQLPMFKLTRKLNNIRLNKTQVNRTAHRYIVNIKPIPPKPMRCITVDSPSSLFLVTRSFIATHNTMVTTNILKRAAEKGYNCLYVTLSDIVVNAVSAISSDKFVARKELMMVDFLVIDEFDARHMGSGPSSDLYGRQLEDIFRKRVENKLPTFMCTNSPNVIETFSGDIRLSIESLMSYVTVIPVLGRDYRKGGL